MTNISQCFTKILLIVCNKNVKVTQHFLQIEDNPTISDVPGFTGGISADLSCGNGRHVTHNTC